MGRRAEVVAEDRVLAVLAVRGEAAVAAVQAAVGGCRRQYQQRVACSRFPATVPMLRSCGDAARRAASRSASGIDRDGLELGERRPRADARCPSIPRGRLAARRRACPPRQPSRSSGTTSVPPASATGSRSPSAPTASSTDRPQELHRSPLRPRLRDAQRSISSRVIGSERTSAPVASRIAFAIAAATGTIGGSPRPFAPRFVRCASGSSTNSQTISGTSAIVGSR